jgi:hypothetical protein
LVGRCFTTSSWIGGARQMCWASSGGAEAPRCCCGVSRGERQLISDGRGFLWA